MAEPAKPMAEQSPESLREAAPAYADLEAKRARAGVAAALFGEADEPGERVAVGRYEIDSRLGAGGMGVVYRAHDPDLDRPVAVKLVHADSSTDDKARARMLREARSLAKLSHPNVITVYDVGTEDGQVFVAMELVAGRDLKRWLDDHRDAAWRRVLELFVAAGRGLEAAHEVALVHRDFKPENVLVGDDGRVRVLDFGLARVHRSVDAPTAEERAPSPQDPASTGAVEGATSVTDGGGVEVELAHMPTTAFAGGLTETGALIGTPLYMAPELYRGAAADVRSDQFAFCASLYEGLYRQLPFGSRNLVAHVDAVRAGRVVAPPVDSGVPSAVWELIARGLDPDPDARWPDMGALLRELEGLAHAPPVTELAEGGGGRWLIAGALVLAAVLGILGLELGWFGSDPPEVPAPSPQGPVDVTPSPSTTTAPGPTSVGETPTGPSQVDAEAEVEAETGETGETGETEETGETGEVIKAEPEGHGWCHLHEDRYTLLLRGSSRRANFEHQGTCYACRVERRRSRTRNFSPRDCAGYSLCGEANEDQCK